MKKRNKIGLKEIILGGTILISGVLFPSFAKAQVTNPENYQDASFRAKMLPFCRPNIHLTEGRDSLDFDHSGDADENNKLDSNDSQAMRNITYFDALKADFAPNLIVEEADAQRLDSVLTGQKENRYEHMNGSERINLLREVLSTDSANYPPEGIYWDCRNYFLAHKKRFSGVEDAENSLVADEELYGKNAIKNIQIYSANVIASNGLNHKLAGILVGPDSNERLMENPENFSHWYFWNPSGPNELQEVKRGDANFADTSLVEIVDYGKMLNGSHSSTSIVKFDQNDNLINSHPYLIPFNPASSQEEITFEGVPENQTVTFTNKNQDFSEYLNQKPDTAYAKSNLPVNVRTEVSEKIPLNAEFPDYHYKQIISPIASTSYKSDTTSTEYIFQYVGTPTADFQEDKVVAFEQGQNLESIIESNSPTNVQDSIDANPEVSYTYSTNQTSNGTYTDVNNTTYVNWKIKNGLGGEITDEQQIDIKDEEPVSGYLTDTYIRRESGQNPEDAIKSLIYHDPDNSGLPVDTVITNTTENYYDAELIDISGNITYLGNAQADYPVGIGEESSDLEKTCELTPYPNPNPFGIKYFQSDFGQTEISVYDMSGRQLRNDIYNSSFGENNIEYDFDLPQGVYIVNMKSETCKDSKKVIIDGRK